MLWGGLKPIRHRFFLDVVTLVALGYSALISTGGVAKDVHADSCSPTFSSGCSHVHISILVLSCLVNFITAGLTQRWTISLPMVPIVFMQCLRYFMNGSPRWEMAIQISSLLLVGNSFLLSIMFPAVNINAVKGKYNVGIVDIHLPVEDFVHEHVSVRLLYPSREKSVRVPYFNIDTADQTCKALIKLAPPPMNKLSFMLNQWKFATIYAKRNAVPFVPSDESKANVNANAEKKDTLKNDEDSSDPNQSNSKLPIVVFSHGITGNAEIYSYQAMSMAANGSLVMSINHTDGSSIGFKRRDGSFLEFDTAIGEIGKQKGRYPESVRHRRKQLNHRVNEFLAATQALIKLNETNVAELDQVGISFANKLNVNDCIAAGHSFGGATALTAAHRRTDLFTACVAHDPAIDWCPDDCRKALLPSDRLKESKLTYNGGTGGYEVEDDASKLTRSPSVHDLDLFFLYSYQWVKLGWGEYRLFQDLFKRGLLGRAHGASDLGFVYNSQHSEFSDSCMKVPLWIARAVKMTGIRNPHETAEEIMTRTSSFIAEVRQQGAPKQKTK